MAMWAWLGQRISGLTALGLVIYHYVDPIQPRVQTLLMLFVGLHAVLGLRVILTDLGVFRRRSR